MSVKSKKSKGNKARKQGSKKAPTKGKKKAGPKKKRIPKKVQDDIKKSVDHIPGIIYEQIRNEQSKQTSERPANVKIDQGQSRGRHGLLWFGVATLTIVVFVMWIWNTKVTIKNIGQNTKSNERTLFENAKQDLSDIMKNIAAGEEDELSKELEEKTPVDVKELLRNLIGGILPTTTSTATSTNSTTKIASTTTPTIDLVTSTPNDILTPTSKPKKDLILILPDN
jgi:hypothetical protein